MIFNVLVLICFVVTASGQRRYYSLEDMPETNFDCRDKILGGYYADPEANCQMFHVCVKIPGQGVQDFRFLCPNETVFDQENQICADSGDIDCEAAGLYLENFDLYRIGSAPAKRPLFTSSKGTVVPLGPSTKSPILTNSINEEDEFYLQRSETGDRRLHSKDLLRGSSSSNFFNNRNKGKDLEEDDDEEPLTKNTGNGQHRPRPNNIVRGKSQYNSQFRKVETTAQPQSTPQVDNQNQLDKKRTKIAVRKLARKRPEDEAAELRPASPTYSSFTTQVTQKFNFGEQDSRYNTINRISTTPSSIPTAVQQKFPQSFKPKNEQPSTPAFFEPSVTPRAFVNEQSRDNNGFLRQPIVAAGANYQNNHNRQNSNYQQTNRPTTPAAGVNQQNYAQNSQQNRQNAPAGNFQQQNRAPLGNIQQVSKLDQQGGNHINFQNPRASQGSPQNNFQPPRTNQPLPPTSTPNFQRTNQPSQSTNVQTARTNQPVVNAQNFQATRTNQPAQGTFQNQRSNSPPNNFRPNQPVNNFQNLVRTNPATQSNYQSGRTNPPTSYPNDHSTSQGSRQTTASIPPNTRAQSINNGLLARTPAAQNRNVYRGNDEFDEGENQEFLKTAPSNNFRPSDLNSFKNTYKGEDNGSKAAQTSTTKYYTPTIITTPRAPSTYTPIDTPSTIRQTNAYPSPQGPTNQPSSQNYYTQAVTRKLQPQPSSTAKPQQASARTFQPTLNQPATTKTAEVKDTVYDYAYYDDGGSFSEYDSLGDSLGETDFSRTSQRSKSRLI